MTHPCYGSVPEYAIVFLHAKTVFLTIRVKQTFFFFIITYSKSYMKNSF